MDEFEREYMERVLRLLRRLYGDLRPMIEGSSFDRWYSEVMSELLDERVSIVRDGVIEPLVSFVDEGDDLVIVVDLPGVKEGSIRINLYEDKLEVEGEIDESIVREAFEGFYWASSIRRFHGVYSLPCRVDPSSVRTEKKGSRLVIKVKKTS